MKEFLFSLLRVPTADVLAVKELEDAKRDLLRSQTALDYTKRMVEYHQDRVKRLTAYVEKSNG